MTKQRLGNELSYARVGYKPERWKWVLSLPSSQHDCVTKEELNYPEAQNITRELLLRVYGLDKHPKEVPCSKRCFQNPWCLGGLKVGGGSSEGKGSRVPLTQQPRDPTSVPVGLQNTANTCWINSALQVFFHTRKFRNAINSLTDFRGDESLGTFAHLLQVIFAEMETHPFRAIACEPGSVFEKLGMFSSREVMKKDANNELLKCVSEFMENTIDWLVADSKLTSVVAPMFTITLTRLAKWQCNSCSRVHQYQLAPASCYTMGAYISADQAPLQQCLMDLQAETQTGVVMVCEGSGEEAGCGASVRVDRVVTPKLNDLPYCLIIRNNSLMAEDVKRRMHVVYPENLNLSQHTLDGRPAHYVLSAVIYHHGHWVKHYSAQVKTESGSWFSFNDEAVLEMIQSKATNTQAVPQENHPNYFSLGAVSAKYKSRSGERVSRGAFIWLYTLVDLEPAPPLVPPRPSVMDYIALRRDSTKSLNNELLAKVHYERQALLAELSVRDLHAPHAFISEWLLHSWLGSMQCRFVVTPALLADFRCEHGKLRPMLAHTFKCIRKNKVIKLLNNRCGIHTSDEDGRNSPTNAVTSTASPHAICAATLETQETQDLSVSSTCAENHSVPDQPDLYKNSGLNTNIKCDLTEKLKQEVKEAALPNGCHDSELDGISSATDEVLHATKRVFSSSDAPDSSSNEVDQSNINPFCDKVQNVSIDSSITVSSVSIPSSPSILATPETTFDIPKVGSSSSEAVSELLHTSRLVCGSEHLCKDCVAKHARHILFLERMRALHKFAKKEACKEMINSYKAVGCATLDLWPKIAVGKYMKDTNTDLSVVNEAVFEEPSDGDDKTKGKGNSNSVNTEDQDGPDSCVNTSFDEGTTAPSDNGLEVPSSSGFPQSPSTSNPVTFEDGNIEDVSGLKLFNEDLVCCHYQLNPQVDCCYLPEGTYNTLLDLCGEAIHPATVVDDFQACADCQNVIAASASACERGLVEKGRLPNLFADRRRPTYGRDNGHTVFLLDRDFYDDWKSYVRSCMRGVIEKRPVISNADLLCVHQCLQYNPALLDAARLSRMWVLVWPEEWSVLVELYGQPRKGAVRAVITHDGFEEIQPAICSFGCVEAQAMADYDDQFEYEYELIYVRQVHTPGDIPQRSAANTRSMGSPVVPPPQVIAPLLGPPTATDTSDTPARVREEIGGAGKNAAVTAGKIEKEAGEECAEGGGASAAVAKESGSDGVDRTLVNKVVTSFSEADMLRNYMSDKRPLEENTDDNEDTCPAKIARLANGHTKTPIGAQTASTSVVSQVTATTVTEASQIGRKSARRRIPKCIGSPLAGAKGGSYYGSKSVGARLVRASKTFSSTDTMRQVQNFIAERTSVWPMLQTLWLCWSEDLANVLGLPAYRDNGSPVQLSDEQLSMTLGALRVRPGDTVYFRAAKEDMEKAAGDGVIEYEEIPN